MTFHFVELSAMNPKSCDSGCIDDERTETFEDPGSDDYKSLDRAHVNVLLNISDEQTFKEQDPFEVQNDIGWEEAVSNLQYLQAYCTKVALLHYYLQ